MLKIEITKVEYKHKYLVPVLTQKSSESPKSEWLKLETKVNNKKCLFYYSKIHNSQNNYWVMRDLFFCTVLKLGVPLGMAMGVKGWQDINFFTNCSKSCRSWWFLLIILTYGVKLQWFTDLGFHGKLECIGTSLLED